MQRRAVPHVLLLFGWLGGGTIRQNYAMNGLLHVHVRVRVCFVYPTPSMKHYIIRVRWQQQSDIMVSGRRLSKAGVVGSTPWPGLLFFYRGRLELDDVYHNTALTCDGDRGKIFAPPVNRQVLFLYLRHTWYDSIVQNTARLTDTNNCLLRYSSMRYSTWKIGSFL